MANLNQEVVKPFSISSVIIFRSTEGITGDVAEQRESFRET